MNSENLHTPIEYLKGVGPNRAELLKKEMGIFSYADLLNLFPNRYIDKTRYYKIRELQRNSAEVQIVGKIVHLKTVEQKRGKRLVAQFIDDTGKMELVWFRGHKWIKESLKINQAYVIFGKVNWFNGSFSMPHPEMELLSEHKKNTRIAMQPVYPSTEKLTKQGVSNRVIIKCIQQIFRENRAGFKETLSAKIIEKYKLLSKSEALLQVHFPQNAEKLSKAQFRLKLEELFFIQLQLIVKNQTRKQKIKGFVFDKVGDYFNTFYQKYLPFELTKAQKRVVKEIRFDLGTGAQMNRLLQGDVGSGKTMVAWLVSLIAFDNNFQVCLMAPTEILATQHYNSLKEMGDKSGIEIALLTGSTKTKDRRILHEKLESGELDLLIGTHAVLEDKVQFKNLGLAIIDEQHRFGVAQRAKLWKKNSLPPHILVMTATPIPRTLAMSLYGDLDISVIDELPPGRKSIKTVHRFDSHRLAVFKFIKDEVKKGRQIYIVYPLIEESQAMDYKDLMDGYESIVREFPMPDYQISIVHGKMKPADKDFEMNRFAKGETQIMVATTVIEVGVNVPNASVMVIESAERFGLSQLHQLRGRVGRGAEQSYCILMSGHKLSQDSKTRLDTMVQTNDGFEIAEVDLKLRGPGDIMGTQQSGVLNLKIADIVKDNQILKIARQEAIQLLKEDPKLTETQNQPIKNTYLKINKNKSIWNYIS
ncbi:ATP-dependent DNA helicase RecG [Haloflavibacter putidus]|uniref:ATP-dependent DNA helicase RecG n=1 Tax=Haloflavibacter putidus TaxID=2576776 RepID=A0A507ZNG3_9FLAO|nr:ATP-dependent DNA helicase RecG [Haloflavibacter putidus]TQD39276.1 ATP-dependent DNA helicase RecG [Haloflavibacter putidus]